MKNQLHWIHSDTKDERNSSEWILHKRPDYMFLNKFIDKTNDYIQKNKQKLVSDSCSRRTSIRNIITHIYNHAGIASEEQLEQTAKILSDENLKKRYPDLFSSLVVYVDERSYEIPDLDDLRNDLQNTIQNISKELQGLKTGWLGYFGNSFGKWASNFHATLSPLLTELEAEKEKLSIFYEELTENSSSDNSFRM